MRKGLPVFHVVIIAKFYVQIVLYGEVGLSVGLSGFLIGELRVFYILLGSCWSSTSCPLLFKCVESRGVSGVGSPHP